MASASDRFVVDKRKAVDYLLSEDHPEGKSKAAFFVSLGFSPQRWEELCESLAQAGLQGETIEQERNRFGEKLVRVSEVAGPSGAKRLVRTVWFRSIPAVGWRLVSAYPEKGGVP
ncbi:MAG: adhesin [Candidatus Sumerlaeia bacterium]|nr:adhesin [Candidatus Sumerlaeia bacterium]